ncbi:MAG: hypothetical protein KatS3mg105_2922 [Gemmatales bacterium]|nr:MAG: hypothetical protein KatS3mg105_2922 [Gemmatales bacterium]
MNRHLGRCARAACLLLSSLSVLFLNRSAPAEPTPLIERERARLLGRLHVPQWHRSGVRGEGIKVAVLDTGFRGYAEHLGRALPDRVVTASFRRDGQFDARDSQHGILCGEIVHAIAPKAELFLITWDTAYPDRFLQALRYAREAGVRIVTCSIIMPSWSDGDGGGAIHQELKKIVGSGHHPGDMLFFASAGNTAQRHWFGDFRPDDHNRHQWRIGRTRNPVSPWGSGRVSVELYWNDDSDYDLEVSDDEGKRVGQCFAYHGNDRSCRVLHFEPDDNHSYSLEVKLRRGKGGRFHTVVLGGGLGIATAQGSIAFPGDGEAVQAVGAIDESGRRATYSSCGSPFCRKPDFVALVPFPSLWRDRPFGGTSAAAPQAAGLAALFWSKYPHLNAAQVLAALRSAAVDLGPQGHDYETGYGAIVLPPLVSRKAN